MTLRCFLAMLALATSVVSGPLTAGLDEGTRAMREGQYQKAFQEWKPLADKGEVTVQAAIAVMYHAGRGVAQDYQQAFKWYRKAAEKGNVAAQANLAVMYFRGLGVAADKVLAYVWYDLAAIKGEGRHRKARDLMADRLTASQMKKAKRLSREYRQKYVDPFRD
ncbi:MAG: sel1 repeat family protein [Gammaproteobacteria bacterium]|nr:sel1 repeat family protein [Gammaproteobacteria bacterium]